MRIVKKYPKQTIAQGTHCVGVKWITLGWWHTYRYAAGLKFFVTQMQKKICWVKEPFTEKPRDCVIFQKAEEPGVCRACVCQKKEGKREVLRCCCHFINCFLFVLVLASQKNKSLTSGMLEIVSTTGLLPGAWLKNKSPISRLAGTIFLLFAHNISLKACCELLVAAMASILHSFPKTTVLRFARVIPQLLNALLEIIHVHATKRPKTFRPKKQTHNSHHFSVHTFSVVLFHFVSQKKEIFVVALDSNWTAQQTIWHVTRNERAGGKGEERYVGWRMGFFCAEKFAALRERWKPVKVNFFVASIPSNH